MYVGFSKAHNVPFGEKGVVESISQKGVNSLTKSKNNGTLKRTSLLTRDIIEVRNGQAQINNYSKTACPFGLVRNVQCFNVRNT